MARGPAPMRFGAMIGNHSADRFHTRLGGTLIGIEPVFVLARPVPPGVSVVGSKLVADG